MKRDIHKTLLDWSKSTRRKPLILQGARQVGKTHALKWLGEVAYKNVVYSNFERESKLKKLFVEPDPLSILENLRNFFGVPIKPKETLIVLDEVQECSTALNSLKYFQEELNEYHIVAAGSLLGVKLGHHESFPVGKVNFMQLRPLCFVEFLDAVDESKLRKVIDDKIDFRALS